MKDNKPTFYSQRFVETHERIFKDKIKQCDEFLLLLLKRKMRKIKPLKMYKIFIRKLKR